MCSKMGLAISPSFNKHLQGSKAIIITLKLEKGITSIQGDSKFRWENPWPLACDNRAHTLGTLLAGFRKKSVSDILLIPKTHSKSMVRALGQPTLRCRACDCLHSPYPAYFREHPYLSHALPQRVELP